MKLWSDSFADGDPIPSRCAFGKHHPDTHVQLCENRNPHLAWSDLPEDTRSLVIICHDPDVPSRGDDVNQEGKTVPLALPRVDFFHWLLVDLDPGRSQVAEGEFAAGVVPRGKDGPHGPFGTRHGRNDYTGWFAGDPDMKGDYFGYDGPCPPWNDERLHRYVFTVYALNVPQAPTKGIFNGAELRDAIDPHIVGEASITGTYHIYPDAKPAT